MIHFDKVIKKFRRNLVLKGVELTIERGHRVALVGSNGAGKTTLIRCLLGLVGRESGTASLCGKPLQDLSRRELARTVAYVPQVLPGNILFSAFEFVMMSRHAYADGFKGRDSDAVGIARHAIERTGIEHLADRPLINLSGGERQKVSIAAALAQQSPVLLLDEPFAHLDPKQQESIRILLAEIGRDEQTTILAATHDLNWAAMDFDRMIGMSAGRVLFDAPPSEFMTSETLGSVFGAEWSIHPHPHTGDPMIVPSPHTPAS